MSHELNKPQGHEAICMCGQRFTDGPTFAAHFLECEVAHPPTPQKEWFLYVDEGTGKRPASDEEQREFGRMIWRMWHDVRELAR